MASTLLLVDVRNENTCLGFAVGGKLASRWHLGTNTSMTVDEAVAAIAAFVQRLEAGMAAIEPEIDEDELVDALVASSPRKPFNGAIIASVVPTLTDIWIQASSRICRTRPLSVGPGLRTELRLGFSDPKTVGADRITEIVAAKKTYGAPCLVITLEATTTFQLLDKQGAFLGGIIAPGMRLGAKALSDAAARLPMVELRAPKLLLGRNTNDAMQSGIIYGEVARIDGLVEKIWNEMGYETPVVMSGRYCDAIASLTAHEVHIDQTLAMRGLITLHDINRKE